MEDFPPSTSPFSVPFFVPRRREERVLSLLSTPLLLPFLCRDEKREEGGWGTPPPYTTLLLSLLRTPTKEGRGGMQDFVPDEEGEEKG